MNQELLVVAPSYSEISKRASDEFDALVKKVGESEVSESVRAGQWFALIDTSVAGGKLVRGPEQGASKLDAEVEKRWKAGARNFQVVDALWFEPARQILLKTGVVGESEVSEMTQAEKDKAAIAKYGKKWRTTDSGHTIGISDGKVVAGNPNVISSESLDEAGPAGAAQKALLDIATKSKGEWTSISDIPFKQVPVKFDKLLSAAGALKKKGLIDYDGKKFRLVEGVKAVTAAAAISEGVEIEDAEDLSEAATRTKIVDVKKWRRTGWSKAADYGERVAIEYQKSENTGSVIILDRYADIVRTPADAKAVADGVIPQLTQAFTMGNYVLANWIFNKYIPGSENIHDKKSWAMSDHLVAELAKAKVDIKKVDGGWEFTLIPSLATMAKAGKGAVENAALDVEESAIGEAGSKVIGDADPKIPFYSTAVTQHLNPFEARVVLAVMDEVKGIRDFHRAKGILLRLWKNPQRAKHQLPEGIYKVVADGMTGPRLIGLAPTPENPFMGPELSAKSKADAIKSMIKGTERGVWTDSTPYSAMESSDTPPWELAEAIIKDRYAEIQPKDKIDDMYARASIFMDIGEEYLSGSIKGTYFIKDDEGRLADTLHADLIGREIGHEIIGLIAPTGMEQIVDYQGIIGSCLQHLVYNDPKFKGAKAFRFKRQTKLFRAEIKSLYDAILKKVKVKAEPVKGKSGDGFKLTFTPPDYAVFLRNHLLPITGEPVEEGISPAALAALASQMGRSDELDKRVSAIFQRALPAFVAYLDGRTGVKGWAGEVSKHNDLVKFDHAASGTAIDIYWEADIGSQNKVDVVVEVTSKTKSKILRFAHVPMAPTALSPEKLLQAAMEFVGESKNEFAARLLEAIMVSESTTFNSEVYSKEFAAELKISKKWADLEDWLLDAYTAGQNPKAGKAAVSDATAKEAAKELGVPKAWQDIQDGFLDAYAAGQKSKGAGAKVSEGYTQRHPDYLAEALCASDGEEISEALTFEYVRPTGPMFRSWDTIMRNIPKEEREAFLQDLVDEFQNIEIRPANLEFSKLALGRKLSALVKAHHGSILPREAFLASSFMLSPMDDNAGVDLRFLKEYQNALWLQLKSVMPLTSAKLARAVELASKFLYKAMASVVGSSVKLSSAGLPMVMLQQSVSPKSETDEIDWEVTIDGDPVEMHLILHVEPYDPKGVSLGKRGHRFQAIGIDSINGDDPQADPALLKAVVDMIDDDFASSIEQELGEQQDERMHRI